MRVRQRKERRKWETNHVGILVKTFIVHPPSQFTPYYELWSIDDRTLTSDPSWYTDTVPGPLKATEHFMDTATVRRKDAWTLMFERAFRQYWGDEFVNERNSWWRMMQGRGKKLYPMTTCSHVVKRRKGFSETGTVQLRHAPFSYNFPTPGYPDGTIYHFVNVAQFVFRLHGLIDHTVIPPIEDPSTCWLSRNEFFTSDLAARCQSTALRRMLPDLEDGFSLPVFLAEIGEVPGMVKGAIKLVSGLPKAARAFLSKPIGTWSRAQLATSFGWLPFIRDVRTIVERLMSLRQDIQGFLDGADKRKTYHYTIRLDAQDLEELEKYIDVVGSTENIQVYPSVHDFPIDALADYFNSISFDVRTVESLSNVMYTATIDYSYTLDNVGEWAPVLAALDRFGVNLSLSDLWEVIPFSFVVDWFFSVQSLVERLDLTNLPPQIVINEFCESLKFSYSKLVSMENVTVETESDHWPDTGWAITPVSRSLRYEENVYHRRAGLPSIKVEDFPNLTLPHGMQIVLGGALIGSRR